MPAHGVFVRFFQSNANAAMPAHPREASFIVSLAGADFTEIALGDYRTSPRICAIGRAAVAAPRPGCTEQRKARKSTSRTGRPK